MTITCENILLALGDISFRGRNESVPDEHVLVNPNINFKKYSHVVANLESPLVSNYTGAVLGKCTLHGGIGWAKILKKCGIDMVTLANNHMMDFGENGLCSTMAALDDAGISYVGAGKDRAAACAPVITEQSGRRIAFLGRSAVEVSSPCYAGPNQAGVAVLDEAEIVSAIRSCRELADCVVVMLHWGVEHYCWPTPQQRTLAKKIVAAGANILIGHHPHVLQGEELIINALVSYSSGNFLFDDFSWSVLNPDGQMREYQSTLTDSNRRGMMLEIACGNDNSITTNQIFTKISPDAKVELDNSIERKAEYELLCERLHGPLYSLRWKLYSLKREWDLRLKSQLSPRYLIKNIHNIRPRHLKEFAVKIRRSTKVSSGKSTNPYEG